MVWPLTKCVKTNEYKRTKFLFFPVLYVRRGRQLSANSKYVFVWLVGGGGEIGGGTAADVCKWGGKVALIDIHEGRLREVVHRCQVGTRGKDLGH